MNITLGTAQIIMCILMTINLGINIAKHGEEKNEKYNWFSTFVAILIQIWILQAGGFFG